MLTRLAKYIKRKLNPELENGMNQDSFNPTPNEIINNIFDKLSPKELANVSLVCHRFESIAKKFPRLANIQTAFFTHKAIILNIKLKDAFAETLRLVSPNNRNNAYPETLGENFELLQKLIKDGAQINSTTIQLIQPLVYQYAVHMEGIICWPDKNLHGNLGIHFKKIHTFSC